MGKHSEISKGTRVMSKTPIPSCEGTVTHVEKTSLGIRRVTVSIYKNGIEEVSYPYAQFVKMCKVIG